ncbi:MAG TPA: polysaccharide biosynthesis tyrosine autokinase [Anaeromyxobacteraceae bacterium]|nr:polysaccharide biosynthesis tyrosine autokinase [Anaeromyxobacteraceae bacterium]
MLPAAAEDLDADDSALRDWVATVASSRWLVLGVAAACVAAAGAWVAVATPVFRSDAVVQVEERSRGIAGLEELTAAFSSTTPAETEIELIRSRALLGGVVERLGLDVVATPRHFPVIGKAIARRAPEGAVRGAPPLLGGFAWGGERIALARLEVPETLLGQALPLVARGDGRFALLGPDGAALLEGQVGAPASGGGVEILVSRLDARPGTGFRVTRLPLDEAVERLQSRLAVSERGRKTGILQIALEGPDRDLVARTVDAVASDYQRQNVDRRSAEAEKTLAFLSGQLPTLRENLDAAEAALERYRRQNGRVDVGLETKGMLDRSADAERRLSELLLQRTELRQRFTDSHPALVSLDDKIARLRAEREAAAARLRDLPEAEMRSASLLRDVKVANELYLVVVNKVQELKVVRSGTIGNVRLLDAAVRGRRPVRPDPIPALLAALAGGLALGVVLAFVRRALARGLEDPEALERASGLPIYASIPHSGAQASLARSARRGAPQECQLLARTDPGDLAVESLRSLRTSVAFALAEADGNVIALGGPSPGVGKSFVSANLAQVLAESGSRVLLVDGDLRKGRLHELLGGGLDPGLADAIVAGEPVPGSIRPTAQAGLDFLPRGRHVPNPSELLGSDRFRRVLEWASRSYDVVLVDTAPILAVTDAALVGRHAAVNLLVVRSGRHPSREIAATVKAYAQGGVRLHAVVLNGARPSRAGGHAYHYQYSYR